MSLKINEQAKPRAYSYLRFSTPEQLKGDSFRRQTALAEAYALKHELDLDDTLTLHDIGVSAFRGLNAIEGHLGKFMEHVASGEVPKGSLLLVESLDRISRQEVGEAHFSFMSLLRSGVRVVTLLDGQEYSWETANAGAGMVQLIISLSILSRAHEESATKASRLKAAWKQKRTLLEGDNRKALTGRVPAWLTLDRETGKLDLVPARAAVVERIFTDTLSGIGQASIAAKLTAEGVKPWGRATYWQRSYIAKILENEAAIGDFTPHTLDYVKGKRTRTPQATVKGYYPAAIPLEVWSEVRAFSDGKRPRSRGRHANRPITNMLAGLAACPLCGGTMTRTNKGSRSRPSYVCIRAKSKAGCSYRSVRVDIVEGALIERLPARLRDAPAGVRDPALDGQIRDLEGAIEESRGRIDQVLAAIERGGEALSLVQRLRELEGEFEEAKTTLRLLESRRATTAGQTVHARIRRLLDALEPEEGDPQAASVNIALQSVFRRVTIDYRHGVLEFEWLHGGEVELPYYLPALR